MQTCPEVELSKRVAQASESSHRNRKREANDFEKSGTGGVWEDTPAIVKKYSIMNSENLRMYP